MECVSKRAEHGTVTRHRQGCWCLPCRAANCAYDKERRERVKDGTADFVVSSELASKHLWALSHAGMGLRAVAEVTGISRRNLYWIRSRKMRCRQSTEERILRVKSWDNGQSLKSAGAWMSNSTTQRRRVEEMVAAGWSKLRIARAMGNANLWWYYRDRIRVSTYVRFSALYRQFKTESKRKAPRDGR